MNVLKNRVDGVVLYSVTKSLPNGDPDAGPRVNKVTEQGEISDVCQKRKVRDLLTLQGHEMFIERGSLLASKIEEMADANGVPRKQTGKKAGKKKDKHEDKHEDNETDEQSMAKEASFRLIHEAACKKYYDVRTFGGVLAHKEYNVQSLHGPVQFTTAFSIDEVDTYNQGITRCAKNSAKDENDDGLNQTMGRKEGVEYGLYRAEFSVSAYRAARSGMTEEDLEAMYEAIRLSWNEFQSANRMGVVPVCLWEFKHPSQLGNVVMQDLTSLVRVELRDPEKSPSCDDDYEVYEDFDQLPKGIVVRRVFTQGSLGRRLAKRPLVSANLK